MNEERIVSARQDRDVYKKLLIPGDYTIVPYEDSRCKIIITDLTCTKNGEPKEIEPECRIFSKNFEGKLLIGDSDCFIDKDFELVLQQMCCGETCEARLVYRDGNNELVKEIKCKVTLDEVTEEQLVSDWSWERLHEAALHHKEQGVQLVKEKRILDAFRRFHKAMKMMISIEPIDPEVIDEEKIKELMDLKVKLYNNLAHCQLQYEEYDAVLQLCNRSLSYDPNSVKALYRRALAYIHLKMYEEAWTDLQRAINLDPHDKAVQIKVNELKPMIENINKKYTNVIKKMFAYFGCFLLK